MQNRCIFQVRDTVCLHLPCQSAYVRACCGGTACGAYLSEIVLTPVCGRMKLKAMLNLALPERVHIPLCTEIRCGCGEEAQFLTEVSVCMRERRQEQCGTYVCFDADVTLYAVVLSSCRPMPLYPSLPF